MYVCIVCILLYFCVLYYISVYCTIFLEKQYAKQRKIIQQINKQTEIEKDSGTKDTRCVCNYLDIAFCWRFH